MQLRDHSFRQLSHFRSRLDFRMGEKPFGTLAGEIRVHAFNVVEQLRHLDPARQNSHIRNKTDLLHQLLALAERVEPHD